MARTYAHRKPRKPNDDAPCGRAVDARRNAELAAARRLRQMPKASLRTDWRNAEEGGDL